MKKLIAKSILVFSVTAFFVMDCTNTITPPGFFTLATMLTLGFVWVVKTLGGE